MIRCIDKHKHHRRAIFRCVSFLFVIGVFAAYKGLKGEDLVEKGANIRKVNQINRTTRVLTANLNAHVPSAHLITLVDQKALLNLKISEKLDYTPSDVIEENLRPLGRHAEEEEECDSRTKADPKWHLVFYIIIMLYMFIALAIVCDEFFVPALEVMSSEKYMNLTMDVSGATLMAAGGSAPELFTSLFGTFQRSQVGFGTIVGSAVFNVLFVIGSCSLLSKEVLHLTWWPLFRDCTYYSISLLVLALFVGIVSEGKVVLWESLVLLGMYVGYVVLMKYNERLYEAITGKVLYPPEDSQTYQATGDGAPVDRRSVLTRMPSERTKSFRWPGTFRTGVLKLLYEPSSWLDTAGVGIVSRIAGTVGDVYSKIDVNENGFIGKNELTALFEELDCHLSPAEFDACFEKLDSNHDGKISEAEFTTWYCRSEERMKAKVKNVFDRFDVNKDGRIDRHEVKRVLETLEPRVTDQDVDASLAAMYQDGSTEEITYQEFSQWYMHSILYDKGQELIDEQLDGVWGRVKPPDTWTILSTLQWVILLPLVSTLWLTVPDVTVYGKDKYCYISFFLSICWIGFYSFVMVWAVEIIGATFGIPSIVMGLTFIAAGTSVPDLLSSVIVARRGQGDMAISSSIGSNIFDVLVGLPLPWLIYTLWPNGYDHIEIGSGGVWVNIFILLGMVVAIVITIHLNGWKLTKLVGGSMFVFYFLFLANAIYQELPFKC